MVSKGIKYLTSDIAKKVDIELMGPLGYTLPQLAELAGLSTAQSVNHYLEKKFPGKAKSAFNILTICGPGNNGADGLIASRHLAMFQYNISVYYPKPTDKEVYKALVQQCKSVEIPFHDKLPKLETFDMIIDAIFGFSFAGDIREPFLTIITAMGKAGVPIASIDTPSGWDVDKGNINQLFTPEVLVSLTLPKKCSEEFKGAHYLGGRFVPKSIAEKYGLEIPVYPGGEQFTLL